MVCLQAGASPIEAVASYYCVLFMEAKRDSVKHPLRLVCVKFINYINKKKTMPVMLKVLGKACVQQWADKAHNDD